MKQPSAPRAHDPGISVVRLLVVAAVLGVVAGVVLARGRHRDVDAIDVAHELVEETRLGSVPLRESVDLMAPDPRSLEGLPAYPGAVPRKILGSRPGQPNAISWFSTSDSVDKVLSYYEQQYSKANMLYTSQRWGKKSGYVSWFEHTPHPDGGLPEFGQGVMHMVSAFHDGSTTMVMMSATDPLAPLDSARGLPQGMSLPEGAKPQVLNTGEVGQARYSVFAAYARLGRDELASEVERRMRSGGWAVSERVVAPDGRVSLVAKRPRWVQMAVIDGSASSSRILFTQEEK